MTQHNPQPLHALQCGHVGAWSETSRPQSSHLISATATSPSRPLHV